jgi:hypothetical protein
MMDGLARSFSMCFLGWRGHASRCFHRFSTIVRFDFLILILMVMGDGISKSYLVHLKLTFTVSKDKRNNNVPAGTGTTQYQIILQ